MTDAQAAGMVEQIEAALEQPGDIELWLKRRVDGTENSAAMEQAYGQLTERLLGEDPPKTGHWEHLLFATAVHSAATRNQHAYDACKNAISEFTEMLGRDAFQGVTDERMVTCATALTVVLSAQQKLRQPIEQAVAALAKKFPSELPAMAERCQDLWQRRGQMSGADGLYTWDTRREEWRLLQDFKPLRPV